MYSFSPLRLTRRPYPITSYLSRNQYSEHGDVVDNDACQGSWLLPPPSLGQADARQGPVKRGRNITPGTEVKSGFICMVSEAYFRELASSSVSELSG